MGTQLIASLLDVNDIDALGAIWTDLQARSDHSFFTSWGWIGCWLRELPCELRPRVLRIENSEGVVGLALFNRKRVRRGRVIVSEGLFLNETGDPEYDSLTIEHNGLLADCAHPDEVFTASLQYLLRKETGWDELFFSGLDAGSGLARCAGEAYPGTRYRIARTQPYYLVNLASLREGGRCYLDSLSANTRQKIRKSMRLYEARGPLCAEHARDLATAWRFYEDMKRMHTAYWRSKGSPGAFAIPFCDAFYRRLIECRFPHNEIQLTCIRAGETPLGYLFSFRYAWHVYSYQSGFEFDDDPKLKPGMVSHSLVIQQAIEQGDDRIYDFLAGDSQYKQSLSDESQSMEWLVVQRDRIRFRIEDALRKLKRVSRI